MGIRICDEGWESVIYTVIEGRFVPLFPCQIMEMGDYEPFRKPLGSDFPRVD